MSKMPPHLRRLKAERKRVREDEKLKMDAAKVCMDVLSVVPVYVLLEKYGWKNKRLSEFISRYAKVMLDVNKGKITTRALAEEILSQANIKYDDGDWYDVRKEDEKNG